MDSQNNSDAECHYEHAEALEIRFPLIVIFTSTICIIGLIGNVISVHVLVRSTMRCTNSFFLVFLSLCDIGVLTSFSLLYIVEVAYDYTENLHVHIVWFKYVREMYLVSNVLQGVSMYCTLAATVERWIVLSRDSLSQGSCTKRGFILWTGLIITLVVGAQMPRYFELKVVKIDNCDSFGMYALEPSDLSLNQLYVYVYSVWVTGVLFCFVPFLLLLILNCGMFYKLNATETKYSTMLATSPLTRRIEDRIKRRKTREATVVISVVVSIFLICNLPSIILTIAEQTSGEFLYEHRRVYSFCRDTVNILAVVNASANFFIYYAFGRSFRKEIFRSLRSVKKLKFGWNFKKQAEVRNRRHQNRAIVQPVTADRVSDETGDFPSDSNTPFIDESIDQETALVD